jgi:hypothetical protein
VLLRQSLVRLGSSSITHFRVVINYQWQHFWP